MTTTVPVYETTLEETDSEKLARNIQTGTKIVKGVEGACVGLMTYKICNQLMPKNASLFTRVVFFIGSFVFGEVLADKNSERIDKFIADTAKSISDIYGED